MRYALASGDWPSITPDDVPARTRQRGKVRRVRDSQSAAGRIAPGWVRLPASHASDHDKDGIRGHFERPFRFLPAARTARRVPVRTAPTAGQAP